MFVLNLSLLNVGFMKKNGLFKFKKFPYGTPQKRKFFQPWNPLVKLSKDLKKLTQKKARFFSLELGRSLPKRILWQVALPSFSIEKKAGSSLVYLPSSWTLFRSLFFGRMWMLNNPSLVPGVTWPVKSKKFLLAKMRAFQTLSHLIGKGKKSFFLKNFMKLWNLSSPTLPFLWSFARSLDSLKSSVCVQSGMFSNLPESFQQLASLKVQLNGWTLHKSQRFQYVADFWTKHPLEFILKWKASPILEVPFHKSFFGKLFISGPSFAHEKKNTLVPNLNKKDSFSREKEKTSYLSMYSVKPFIWLASFYKDGVVKKTTKMLPTKRKKSYFLSFLKNFKNKKL